LRRRIIKGEEVVVSFFRNYGPQLGQIGILTFLVGTFLAYAVYMVRPVKPPVSVATNVRAPEPAKPQVRPSATPQLAALAKLPPPAKAVRRRAPKAAPEPTFVEPKLAAPNSPIWTK
jgi:hypothetical protein